MRVTRSKSPDGPYVDICDRNVADNNPTDAESVGNKLAGNYMFYGASQGYAALGHNSVLIEDTKYFIVYHTRFEDVNGRVTLWHNQDVNQLFFNSDGWPVIAPNLYAGESAGKVDKADVVGIYDVIEHSPTGNTTTFVNSVPYSLQTDGDIISTTDSPGKVGEWMRTGEYYFKITINGTKYNGVIVPQYVNDRSNGINCATLSFTGVSDFGNSMWANGRQ